MVFSKYHDLQETEAHLIAVLKGVLGERGLTYVSQLIAEQRSFKTGRRVPNFKELPDRKKANAIGCTCIAVPLPTPQRLRKKV